MSSLVVLNVKTKINLETNSKPAKSKLARIKAKSLLKVPINAGTRERNPMVGGSFSGYSTGGGGGGGIIYLFGGGSGWRDFKI